MEDAVLPPLEATLFPHKNVLDKLCAIGKKFALVEDDALVAQATAICLEGLGGQVKCFSRAEDALLHANVELANYYVVDYMLGGALNGIQFLNLLHKKLGHPVNAVLMTGDTSSNFIRESTGFDWPVLYKPVDVSELLASLRAQESLNQQASLLTSEFSD